MTAQKTPEEIARETLEIANRKYANKVYNRLFECQVETLAQALRDAREAAIDECAATVECPSCENRSDSIYVNAHDVMNKIRALKGKS